MWLPVSYLPLLAHGFCLLHGSLGLYIGRAVVLTASLPADAAPVTSVYIHVYPRADSMTSDSSDSSSDSTSSTDSSSKSSDSDSATSDASGTSSTSSTFSTTSTASSETSTSSTTGSPTSSSLIPSPTSSIPSATASSEVAAAPASDQKRSKAMFTAGCFMAVFFTLALAGLVAYIQRKRIIPRLWACLPVVKRAVSAIEESQLRFYETAVAFVDSLHKKTRQGTKRVTRLFELEHNDYRAKSLPPTPSPMCELPITSEMPPASEVPVPFWWSAASATIPTPVPPAAAPPPPVHATTRTASPSPWPRPLDLRRQLSIQRYNRRMHQSAANGAQPIELPASPVSSQLLQERRETILRSMGYPVDGCNSPEPQLQDAQLHLLQRIHIVQPSSPARQAQLFRAPTRKPVK